MTVQESALLLGGAIQVKTRFSLFDTMDSYKYVSTDCVMDILIDFGRYIEVETSL